MGFFMGGRWFAYAAMCAILGGCTVTPKPMNDDELRRQAVGSAVRATADQAPLSKPVTLYEAMARAVKYNLNARMKKAETLLKLRQMELATAAQLPNLIAELDYSGRNNWDGASSRSLLTGLQSLEPSTSTDRQLEKWNLRLSWNILDFGLSYVRARQAADRALIAEEKRRKAVHRLVQEVRTAFWKAAAAEKLSRKLAGLSGRIRAAHLNERALEGGGTASPLIALTYQRELLEQEIEVQRLQRELGAAKAQLATLMNLPPGRAFRLSPAGSRDVIAKKMPPARDMMAIALMQRPELRQAGYSSRINQKEALAALLELLPGIAPLLSRDHDSNSFAFENNWVMASAKASWNLMQIFSYPRKKAAIAAAGNALDKKALATAMTIMMQVQVSRYNCALARRRYFLAQELFNVESRILRQMSIAHTAGDIGEHTLLRQELRTLAAAAKRDIRYAEYEGAYGTLFVSLGSGMGLEDIDEEMPVELMTVVIAHNWRMADSPSIVGSIPGTPAH